jgi:hypothetical protein
MKLLISKKLTAGFGLALAVSIDSLITEKLPHRREIIVSRRKQSFEAAQLQHVSLALATPGENQRAIYA